MSETLADRIADAMADHGVARLFGVPGGGSSLDLIDAAAARGIPFILSQTETAGAIMAAVTGELTGSPGAVLTGVGPGAASAVNGAAYAALERAPLVLFTDRVEGEEAGGIHQKFDQIALFAPLAKAAATLEAEDGDGRFRGLLATCRAHPAGPVHVDLSAGQAAWASAPAPASFNKPSKTPAVPAVDVPELRRCRKPVLAVGLEARDPAIAEAILGFLEKHPCPVLTTYKAKGVVPDSHPCLIGHVTGGTAEADALHRADLILAVGVDPVELINRPWPYAAAVVEMAAAAHTGGPFHPVASLTGDVAVLVEALVGAVSADGWTGADIEGLRTGMADRFGAGQTGSDDPRLLVPALQAGAMGDVTLSVDSGAHMFPAMALWQASRPFGVLKSNGLSTMGFALPAAIAASLHDPTRKVIALTGDGGLSMCLSELATAARLGVDVVTVVFNDAALSLIDIKQQAQQRPSRGVRYPAVDYAAAAGAFGVPGVSVTGADALERAVRDALARPGPGLIEVAVDPSGYPEMLAALRQ